MIEFFFFGKPIKTLGSLGKIRVGRVTGNTHIFFFWPYTHHNLNFIHFIFFLTCFKIHTSICM